MNHFHRSGDSPILIPWTTEDLDSYLAETFQKTSMEEIVLRLLRVRLPDEVAERRAPMVVEDMEAVGFTLQVDRSRAAPGYFEMGLPVPVQYHIRDPRWTVDHADPKQGIEGTHLNRGDLVLLSKVCELGRKHLPGVWPKRFKAELTDPEQHLSCLNEVWWIGRFRDPRNVMKLDGKKNGSAAPDWGFSHESLGMNFPIRLEVKRRPSDTRKHVGLSEKSISLDDIVKKFKSGEPQEIKLAAMAIYSTVDQALLDALGSWLSSESEMDGVVLWSQEARGGPSLAWVARDGIDLVLRDIVLPPDDEDSSGISTIRHTMPNVTPADLLRTSSADNSDDKNQSG